MKKPSKNLALDSLQKELIVKAAIYGRIYNYIPTKDNFIISLKDLKQ